jgi:tetratricopeptide (TPR) repeat protein
LLPAFLLLVLEAWFSWRKKSAVVLLLCALGPALSAQAAHQLLRNGDRSYERSDYREAEQAYRSACEKTPENIKGHYNLGNALYRQGNYADAEKRFEQAAQASKDPALQADALHNLGNTLLQQQKYQQAIQAYENSLRRRPADPETKVNLQLAKKKLQQQQQEQQKKQEQQQQPQDPSPGQQPEEQPQQPDQQSQPQDQPNQQPAEQQPADGKMTREEARRILETAVSPEDKRNARKYREQEPGKHQERPKKDW